jgi:hypothetical protein
MAAGEGARRLLGLALSCVGDNNNIHKHAQAHAPQKRQRSTLGRHSLRLLSACSSRVSVSTAYRGPIAKIKEPRRPGQRVPILQSPNKSKPTLLRLLLPFFFFIEERIEARRVGE